MQGNRDGSWSLGTSRSGGSGKGKGGYLPQATRVFSNFNVQQPIRYNFQTQQNLNFPHPQFGAAGANVQVMRIDNVVNKTRKSLVSAGETVSSTRVSQLVLAQLQADSWRHLGIQMQDVPSLRQFMSLEGKIIAFIHCFIAARRIMTLYDLKWQYAETSLSIVLMIWIWDLCCSNYLSCSIFHPSLVLLAQFRSLVRR